MKANDLNLACMHVSIRCPKS